MDGVWDRAGVGSEVGGQRVGTKSWVVLEFGIMFGAGGWGRVGASVRIRVKVIAALLAASSAAASAAFLTAEAFG